MASRQAGRTDSLWKLLEAVMESAPCDSVAIRTLVPGEVAVIDTFFQIVFPGSRTATLWEEEEQRLSQ